MYNEEHDESPYGSTYVYARRHYPTDRPLTVRERWLMRWDRLVSCPAAICIAIGVRLGLINHPF